MGLECETNPGAKPENGFMEPTQIQFAVRFGAHLGEKYLIPGDPTRSSNITG